MRVILVDDGSSDGTAQIAALHKRFAICVRENLGLSAARNAGIRAAAGEIIAFTDAGLSGR
jgi:glycosyltransferase involved in cell wall biosynthesis